MASFGAHQKSWNYGLYYATHTCRSDAGADLTVWLICWRQYWDRFWVTKLQKTELIANYEIIINHWVLINSLGFSICHHHHAHTRWHTIPLQTSVVRVLHKFYSRLSSMGCRQHIQHPTQEKMAGLCSHSNTMLEYVLWRVIQLSLAEYT